MDAKSGCSSSENEKPMNAPPSSSGEAELMSPSDDCSENDKQKPGSPEEERAKAPGSEESSSENEKPAASTRPKASSQRRVAAKRDKADTSSDSKEPQKGVSKDVKGHKKKRAAKEAADYSDSSEPQLGEASVQESGIKMELRRRSSINYKEVDPDQVTDDPQQILMTAYYKLKKDLCDFGKEDTEEETHKNVMAFLLTERMRIDVSESAVDGDGGFAAKDAKTGAVLGVLTSTMLSRKLPKDKERTFQGLTWGDDKQCIAGFVNSCCVVHKKLKRNQERVCPSNCEFRMVRVRHENTWLWYVVLMALRDIAQGEELFAYYRVKNPAPPANPSTEAVSGDGDAEESEAEESEAEASEAEASEAQQSEAEASEAQQSDQQDSDGIAAQGGSARRGSSKQSQKAPQAPAPPPSAHNGPARTRGGRGPGYNVRGGRGGNAPQHTETRVDEGVEDRPDLRSRGPARVRGGFGAQRGPLVRRRTVPKLPGPSLSDHELSFDTSNSDRQAAVEAKRARRAAREAEEAISAPSSDEVPESQYEPGASHSHGRGQSSHGEW